MGNSSLQASTVLRAIAQGDDGPQSVSSDSCALLAGALFRCYPGPWQVLRRDPSDPWDLAVVEVRDKMPSLKEVSLEILPRS